MTGWVIKVCELATPKGFLKGKYRLTAVPEGDAKAPALGLCTHEHFDEGTAWRCKPAQREAKKYQAHKPRTWKSLS